MIKEEKNNEANKKKALHIGGVSGSSIPEPPKTTTM